MKSNSFSHSWWGDEDVWHALGFPVDQTKVLHGRQLAEVRYLHRPR